MIIVFEIGASAVERPAGNERGAGDEWGTLLRRLAADRPFDFAQDRQAVMQH